MHGYRFKTNIFREMARSPVFGMGVVLALVGTVFVIHFGGLGLLHFRLGNSGVAARATVQEVSRTHHGSSTRPVVRLEYSDQLGGKHLVRKTVRSSAYHPGEIVGIVHDPDFPRFILLQSELKSPREIRELTIMAGIGILCAAFGWPILFRRWRRGLLAVRLNRNGWPCRGEVLEILTKSYRVGNRCPRYIRYYFCGPDGQYREGVSDTLPPNFQSPVRPGTPLTVLCNRERPEEHMPLLDALADTVGNPT